MMTGKKYKVIGASSSNKLNYGKAAKVGDIVDSDHLQHHMDFGKGIVHIHTHRPNPNFMPEENLQNESTIKTLSQIAPDTSRRSKSGMGIVTQTSTGVKHERDYDRLDKEAEAAVNAAKAAAGIQKRGRGRPKKDKFAEAVEFLITLEEAEFEHYTQHGFDVFFEAFHNVSDDSDK
jgi:hypothetical protein